MHKHTAMVRIALMAACLFLIGLAAVPRAAAQDTGMMADAAMSQMLNDNLKRNLEPAPHQGARPFAHQGARPSAPTAARAVLTYHRSPAVSARVVKQYADWYAKTGGPDKAKLLQTELTKHDPVAMWADAERSDGLKPGDVADAMASYWVMNWMIANGVQSTTAAQVQGVKRKVVPILLANPAIAGLSEAQRQEMAETLMINYIMQALAFGAATKQGDKGLLQRLGDAAVTRFKNEAHVDLRAVRLTDSGFVRA